MIDQLTISYILMIGGSAIVVISVCKMTLYFLNERRRTTKEPPYVERTEGKRTRKLKEL